MSEKALRQSEKMKEQTIGVEVEMNNITRERAAKVRHQRVTGTFLPMP